MNYKVFIRRTILLFGLFFLLDFLISLILLTGLNKYYGIYQKPEVLINGSSMTMSGFSRTDMEQITKKKIACYSHEGVSVVERFAMIDYFFRICPQGVNTVIYEVNPLMFSSTKTADNVYTIFYPYLDNRLIDRFVKDRASNKEYYTNKIIRTKRFESRIIGDIISGYLGKYNNIKTNTLDTLAILQFIDLNGHIDVMMKQSSIEVFENTMDEIRAHNSVILLIMMPMYYLKYQTFNEEGYNKLCKYFEDYCLSASDTKFLDMNQDSIIYQAGYFSDPLHLNAYGQSYVTQKVSSYIINNPDLKENTQCLKSSH